MATATQKKTEIAEIEQRIEDWSAAIARKDLDGVMAFYTDDVTAFDVILPLRMAGADAYAKNWEYGFEMCQDEGEFSRHESTIVAEGDLAFCHWLNRMAGTTTEGEPYDCYVRWTQCWRKIAGAWLIAHEHVSFPIDMETNKAVMDAKP